MEEIEVPIEHLQEEIHHHAEHSSAKWVSGIALSSAILAALAAVTALLAGHHANEAVIDQLHASDSWSYYQAKGVKAAILMAKATETDADREKLGEYKKEQEEIKAEAEKQARESETHLRTHEILANGVTFFQVAISIAAISALTRKKRYWWVSLAFGAAGLYFLIAGLRA
jgi:hypothetical protein